MNLPISHPKPPHSVPKSNFGTLCFILRSPVFGFVMHFIGYLLQMFSTYFY